jgi:hypothetical protein
LTVTPYTWIPWSEARSRMPEVWSGWRLDGYHADRAMVNSLRRGKVPYRGGAEILNFPFLNRPVRLQDVVVGLLNLNLLLKEAEYEQADISPGFLVGRFVNPPRPMTQKRVAWLIDAELAWEEFRDDLIRFELPRDATPNPDLTEATTSNQRVPRQKRSRQLQAYKRRVRQFEKLGRPPPVQTTADGKTIGDREWASQHGVSRKEITKWRAQELGPQARGRPRNFDRK